jgi:excisionase family DNA binding protein
MLDLSAYVTVSQAADELAVHPETVRRMLRQERLPGSKAGTIWLIAKSDLSDFKARYASRHRSERSDEVGR